jgi:hypothetical protein
MSLNGKKNKKYVILTTTDVATMLLTLPHASLCST